MTILSYCHYCLSDTSLENLLPYLQAKQAGIINASSINGIAFTAGAPPCPASNEIKQVCANAARYCAEHGEPIEKLAIQFAVQPPQIATTLVGTASPENVKRNIQWIEGRLMKNCYPISLIFSSRSTTKPGHQDDRKIIELRKYVMVNSFCVSQKPGFFEKTRFLPVNTDKNLFIIPEPIMSQKIDTHHHFWKYNAEEYSWIDEKMQKIRRDFLPDELEDSIQEVGITGVISVQARQTLQETEWLLDLAWNMRLSWVWSAGCP